MFYIPYMQVFVLQSLQMVLLYNTGFCYVFCNFQQYLDIHLTRHVVNSMYVAVHVLHVTYYKALLI